ncbi:MULTISPECIES: hypothetical protein [unclassified Lysobacter]|uniref:hypothetical protein n=1 Tax=unclassified Lysobacter TaxID=2635362 RepID=UPI001BE6EF07|nr:MULTISPECIES: hypothetical protein [unclassified Lysobacter]MBT2748358.1 hypothetical protein [Lysobacter sp. ISL-42]MBT2749875.1 hypothetical protein [Lysobacter sp. ISL-50]MBT2781203.1 hypothetical protein [Lysobacter sp. ISL-52]
MANMSYCRFHNTLHALRDCDHVLGDMVDGDPERLSAEELEATKELATTCLNIVQMLAERGSLAFEPDMDLARVVEELNDSAT